MSNESHTLMKLPDEIFPTDMHGFPKAAGGGKKQAGSDLFAMGSTDGEFLSNLYTITAQSHYEMVTYPILTITWSMKRHSGLYVH